MNVFPKFSSGPALALALTLLTAGSAPAAPAGQSSRPSSLRAGLRLAGHVPAAAVAGARLVGRVPAGETVSLALTLPVRNPAGLDDLLRRLYTPGDPLQGRFLTPDEFAARFSPTESDYAAVAAFARSKGLTVTGTHANRLILDAAGPAATVESALGLRLWQYRSSAGRLFRAPDTDPALPAALAGRLAGVVGLDTAALRRPRLRPAVLNPAIGSAAGSGQGGGYTPADIRAAYGLSGVTATGAGQAIALFELDGYAVSDIRAYETATGLPVVPLQNISVDGATGSVGANADEVTLDIELAQALAPGISKILVYQTPNGTDANILDGYSRIAADNLAKQVSTSWGAPEGFSSSAILQGENTIFKQMAAQGQSVLSVTGDNGAYDNAGLNADGTVNPSARGTLSLDDPGSQPYVTGVGGTTLTTGVGGVYGGESVWGDPTDTSFSPRGSGGGGGFSAVWPVPSYQSGLRNAPSGRSVPDVALNSDPQTGYSIYSGGRWVVYGGTSTAAPLWAGFTALVNQQRAAAGLAPIGFLNPTIYAIGASPAYISDFHDITVGNNLYYPAATGYDNATGWGTPVGSALLSTLVGGPAAATTGTLTGTVTASDTGAAFSGVTVTAVSSAGGVTVGTTTTDTAGAYALALPSGLPLTVRADAYTGTGGKYGGAKAVSLSLTAGAAATQNFTVGLAHTFPAGLQMISAPFSYSSADDLAVLFGVASPLPVSGPRFAYWSPDAISYLFYPASPVNTLLPGFGYWARFAAPSYLHYNGPAVSTASAFQVPLSAGWNQIGDPFPAPVALSALTVAGGPLLSSAAVSPTLYRYDTASGTYVALAATDALQPYAGCWLYARQPLTLSIPVPAGL